MGMIMSSMGLGGTGQQLASKVLTHGSGILYDQFVNKEIKDFDDFHSAILDIFNNINTGLPGKHYDAPSRTEILDLFTRWNASKEDDKKDMFRDFMIKNVNMSKVDQSMMMTGIVAPPAAMVAKRTGQSVPQLSVMKHIPDVVFVPTATVLLLTAVKVTKRMLFKNVES